MNHKIWQALSSLLTVLCALAANSAKAADYQVLYSFTGSPGSGYFPQGNLTVDGSTLYGTTIAGGSANLGTVFKIGTDGNGFSLLHSFVSGASDGMSPVASLTLNGSTLYGTTVDGGSNADGTCFSIGTNGTGFTLLHTFTNSGDGIYPECNLTLGGSILYGTDRAGGSNNMGFIYKMGTNGSGFTTLRALQIPDGVVPRGSLVLNNSILYGMASDGGSADGGTIFKLNTDGSGFGVLHSFAGSDGQCPQDSLTLVGSTLYGMTFDVGVNNPAGTIFKINTDGTGFSVLHTFAGGSSDGLAPNGSLILAGSDLYGMTGEGGSSNMGTLFKIGLDGSDFSVLHSFQGGSDGRMPWADLTLSGSTLYGMTGAGGTNDVGTIFSLAVTVPEPSTLVLVGIGAISLLAYAWRRRKRTA